MWWVREGLLPTNIIKGLGSLGPEPFSENFNINYLNKSNFKKNKIYKIYFIRSNNSCWNRKYICR